MMNKTKHNKWLSKRNVLLLGLGLLMLMGINYRGIKLTGGGETAVYIIQGADMAAAVTAVTNTGATVLHHFDIINAVSASLNANQKQTLEQQPGILRVWNNMSVQTADSADPGIVFSPVSGLETKHNAFDIGRIADCYDSRDALEKPVIGPEKIAHVHQGYTFEPAYDPNNLPQSANLYLNFYEKDLAYAVVYVYQASTGIWHPFTIRTTNSNDRLINTNFNLSNVLTSAQDYEQVQVRFAGSSQVSDSGKAEVDCVWLNLNNFWTNYEPVTGYETKLSGFDLNRIRQLDGSRDGMDDIPEAAEKHYGFYQSYIFQPTFDPNNFPGLIDLQFTFKEKGLDIARLEVYQATTGIWHAYDIPGIELTEDKEIQAVIDVSDALETAADLTRVEVRFVMSRPAGGDKAEVDFIGLRLANLAGDITTLDATQSFVAVNASPVWAQGNIGNGIGIAVLDTGGKKYAELDRDSNGNKNSYIAGYNAFTNKNNPNDKNGHGTIISSIISNSKKKNGTTNLYYGIAPDSVVIPVQVLDKDGRGSYTDIIAGIQWVIENKDTYNIRVMNMSLSATPQSYYWDDPLNQAVMRAWQAGIVVVVSAGNGGPDPMSIGVPGNVPYVITVGAFTDAYTPNDWSDDYIPAFSAAGPTYEGFVKPDVIAPGGHVLGLMSDKSRLAQENPEHKIDKDYYQMSGTSMSAAQVSGVVALMLTAHPELTPDDVKCRLMSTAVPAVNTDGTLAYSIFQQGTGRVDAYAAVNSSASGCANNGLNIASDLDGSQHYMGKANRDADGNYYIVDEAGWAWSGGWAWSEGWAWSGGWAWSEGWAWSGGWAWSEGWAWSGSWAWSESSAVTSVWLPED